MASINQLNNGTWFTTRTIEPMKFNSIDTESLNNNVLNTVNNDNNDFIFTHYYTEKICTQRLIDEACKHNLIVAFDFDNTIYKYNKDYDILKYDKNINNLVYKCILDILKDCQGLGMILILYTVENDKKKIAEKKSFCKELGLNIKYVNESPIFTNSGKAYYNILLDDRAGLSEAYKELSEVIVYLKNNKTNMSDSSIIK